MALSITSQAFRNGDVIPVRCTCDGADLSPHLEWSGLPPGARSLVLVVDDPDAPDPAKPQRTWVHWVLYDISPDVRELGEGAATRGLPSGTREGTNDWERTGYGGPCPPIGRHRYFFKLFALDAMLGDLNAPTTRALEAAINDHVIERAALIGTYERKKRSRTR